MAAPHNPKRYGELWPADQIAELQTQIERIKDLVVVSGGWAWHCMSPPHAELKHAHDHKDADIFVAPPVLWELISRLHAHFTV